MRKLLALFLFMFIGLSWAQAHELDSIGTKVVNGKTYIQYRVEAGETAYSIAKKYKISIQDIIDVNPEVANGLKANSIILIPYTPPEDNKVTHHIVLSGETLYKIAQKYNISVSDLRKWNGLRNDNINIGQRLRVVPPEEYDFEDPDAEEEEEEIQEEEQEEQDNNQEFGLDLDTRDSVITFDSTTVNPQQEFERQLKLEEEARERARMDSIAQALAPKDYEKDNKDSLLVLNEEDLVEIDYKSNRTVLPSGEIIDNGGCEIIDDPKVDQNRNYCYHPDAPIGTIIMITNPNNDRSVFVRVIGNYDPEVGNYVIVRITKEAAQKIGASGDYFQVNLSYTE